MAIINESAGASLDAAASAGTTYAMSVGDTFNGNLDRKFDEDWVGIELERGKTYRITLSGRGTAPDKAEDTILKLFDSSGNHLLTNDDIDPANRIFDSRLTFTVLAGGTYYIGAGSYTSNPGTDNSGTYTILVEEIEAVTVIGDTITGTSRGNSLTGTDETEKIHGLGGNDYLYGHGGDDELYGGTGNDTLNGGAGADRLAGGDGDDTASYSGSPAGVTVRLHDPAPRGGDAEGDIFARTVTFAYADNGRRAEVELPDIINLRGSDHDDILAGDQRANNLFGGRGDDTLYGGPGGDDTIIDTMDGGQGDDRLFGGRGDDDLYGGEGSDALKGGAGSDELWGGSGADVLDGGAGADVLDGGIGFDTFIFAPGHGEDAITDFRNGNDVIDISAFGLAGFDDLAVSSGADGAVIDLTEHGGGTILLEGFDIANLDASDFLF
ncbi:MAG: hypothetical protein F4147_03200 [Gammaproteobacteria bacterium]|nr:hypothetical protein [Gammaproteobacteria bacterium]